MSKNKKKGLGRGLKALFGDQKVEPNKNQKTIDKHRNGEQKY